MLIYVLASSTNETVFIDNIDIYCGRRKAGTQRVCYCRAPVDRCVASVLDVYVTRVRFRRARGSLVYRRKLQSNRGRHVENSAQLACLRRSYIHVTSN